MTLWEIKFTANIYEIGTNEYIYCNSNNEIHRDVPAQP